MANYSFSLQIDKWIAKTEGKMKAFLLEFVQDIFLEIVEKTPVLTGFAKNSWYGVLNNGDAPNPVSLTYGSDYRSSSPFGTFAATIGNLEPTDTVWINNSANYISDLEYGKSQKAPEGMVRVTLADAARIASEVLSRIIK